MQAKDPFNVVEIAWKKAKPMLTERPWQPATVRVVSRVLGLGQVTFKVEDGVVCASVTYDNIVVCDASELDSLGAAKKGA